MLLITAAAATLAAVGGGVIWSWDVFARPDIRREVKAETGPIYESQEYILYLLMEATPDTIVDKATARYTANKQARMLSIGKK
jgi:hypothetical protein